MSKRRVVEVAGLHHTNPIPVASVVGNILVTGGIFGRDPDTGQLGDDLPTQCRFLFASIEAVMKAADGTTDDIVKVTVWLRDISDKDPLNAEWCRMFPDPDSRPARHTMAEPTMAGGQLIQAEFMAVMG